MGDLENVKIKIQNSSGVHLNIVGGFSLE